DDSAGPSTLGAARQNGALRQERVGGRGGASEGEAARSGTGGLARRSDGIVRQARTAPSGCGHETSPTGEMTPEKRSWRNRLNLGRRFLMAQPGDTKVAPSPRDMLL